VGSIGLLFGIVLETPTTLAAVIGWKEQFILPLPHFKISLDITYTNMGMVMMMSHNNGLLFMFHQSAFDRSGVACRHVSNLNLDSTSGGFKVTERMYFDSRARSKHDLELSPKVLIEESTFVYNITIYYLFAYLSTLKLYLAAWQHTSTIYHLFYHSTQDKFHIRPNNLYAPSTLYLPCILILFFKFLCILYLTIYNLHSRNHSN
jgi:hypothetical protein